MKDDGKCDPTGEGDDAADDVKNTKHDRHLDMVGLFQVLRLLGGRLDHLWCSLMTHFI